MGKPELPKKKFYQREVTDDDKKLPKNLAIIYRVFSVILPIALLIGFLLIVTIGKKKEIWFAFKHPQMVGELREIYQLEHDEADKSVLMRQRMVLPEEEVKKE